WWLLSELVPGRPARLILFGTGAVLLALRITVPGTLAAGILPTGDTIELLGSELSLAWATIQTGIPPVVPHAGILAILAILMWIVGGFFTWGSTDGPHAALFLPPFVMYFQFAVFDRVQAGLGWMMFSGLALVLAAVSMALERRGETGRGRDAEGRPLARRSAAMAAVMASLLGVGSVAVADAASDTISEYGNAPWRTGDGLGPGPGSGVAYAGLVELRQRVLNQSDVPVFTARLAAGTSPDVNPYWTMDSLDTFDGQEWSRSDTTSTRYDPESTVVAPENIYQGTTEELLQTVQIQALDSVIAPTAGTPIEIQDPASTADSPRFARDFYSVGGVSLGVSGGLNQRDQYQLRSLVVDRTADLGALATSNSGDLSPIFASAAEAGEFPHQPGALSGFLAVLPDRERYVRLPTNTPAGIASTARTVVAGHTTDFEAAWMLQSWFRDSGEFTYSTEVTTGHASLVLDDWLNDTTSRNYRTGYCEQFAAAMAVLARSLDIPARVVWGFTPGDVDANGVITVRDTNAHAWVELWMEPYGWYPFDPTPRAEQTGFASQPPSLTAGLDPAEYLEAPRDNPVGGPVNPIEEQQSVNDIAPGPLAGSSDSGVRWWLIAIIALLPLLGVTPLIKWVRRRRRIRRVRSGDITAAWDEIVDRLVDLRVDVPSSLTPVEVARATDHALLPLAHSYSSTVYGGRQGQATESDLVEVEWWIERTYQGQERARAALSLRSLMRSR
ncbi:MAG TPA: transglutaminaseTgpA domain-containing protein, partial [Acidimicrobiia bacterium]|nr:transglutaminaseTgpA domain-containing protein [Acidimicrobiia bacterium]